jgi:hypothetical protein
MSLRSCRALLYGILVCGIFVGGCSTTFKVANLDSQTGRFLTRTKLGPESYLVRKNINARAFKQLLYIRGIDTRGEDKVSNFFIQSFANIGFFESVKDKVEMEKFIIAKGLADSTPNVSDLIGLNRLEKRIGKFLVADCLLKWEMGNWFTFQVIFFNPEDGQEVLHISHRAYNLAGLDDPLFYPVFNAVKDWIDENKGS